MADDGRKMEMATNRRWPPWLVAMVVFLLDFLADQGTYTRQHILKYASINEYKDPPHLYFSLGGGGRWRFRGMKRRQWWC